MTEPNSGERPLWRIPQNAGLGFKTLDGEGLVFNALSGDTHLLSSTGLEILRFISEQQGVEGSSSEAVTHYLVGELDLETQAQVEKNLEYLTQLGLLEHLFS